MMTSASPVLVPREDPIGKIVFAVVALAFGLICFVALLTLLTAVLREPSARCRAAVEEAPLRALLTGLAGYALLGSLAWYLLSGAFIKRLLETEIVVSWLVGGLAVVVLLLIVSLLGAAGTVTALGDRLAELHGRPLSGLRRTMLATVIAVLAAWFPVVGWFVVAPGLLLVSFGAAVLGLARWRRTPVHAVDSLPLAEDADARSETAA